MTGICRLETERLTLRGPAGPDADALAAFYASPRSAMAGGPLTTEAAWRQLAAEIGHWAIRGHGRWMLDLRATGETVGMAGLWSPLGWPEPEVGWDLFEGHEGRGYATEAARAACDHAFGVLGWSTLVSLIDPANAASAAVARRLGGRPEGEFRHERFGARRIWRYPAPEARA